MSQNYTIAELAERWQCSQSKLRQMIKANRIRAWRVDGWTWRISRDEVERHEGGTANHSEQNAA